MISESSKALPDSKSTNESSGGFDSGRFKHLMACRRTNSMPDASFHRDINDPQDSLDEDKNQILLKKRDKIQVLQQQKSDLGPLSQHQQEVCRWEQQEVDIPSSKKFEGRDFKQQEKTTSTMLTGFNSKRVQELKAALLSKHFNQDAIDPRILSKAKRLQKFPSLRKQGSPQALAGLAELAKTTQPPMQLLRRFNAAEDKYIPTTTGLSANKDISANRFRSGDVYNFSIDPSRTSNGITRSKTRSFLFALLCLPLFVTVVGFVGQPKYDGIFTYVEFVTSLHRYDSTLSPGQRWSFLHSWLDETHSKCWISLQAYFNASTTWILNRAVFKGSGIEDRIVLGSDHRQDFMSHDKHERSISLHPNGFPVESLWFKQFWLGDSITHNDMFFYTNLDFIYCDDALYCPSVKLTNITSTGSITSTKQKFTTTAKIVASSSRRKKRICNATNFHDLYSFQRASKPNKLRNASFISATQRTSIADHIADHIADDSNLSISIFRPWISSKNLLCPDFLVPKDPGLIPVKIGNMSSISAARMNLSAMKNNNNCTWINDPGLIRPASSTAVQRWGSLNSTKDYYSANLSWAPPGAPGNLIDKNNSKSDHSRDAIQLENFSHRNAFVIFASFNKLNLSAYDEDGIQQTIITEERNKFINLALAKVQIADHLDKFGEILKGATLTVWVSTQ